jgi:hypothetical protein
MTTSDLPEAATSAEVSAAAIEPGAAGSATPAASAPGRAVRPVGVPITVLAPLQPPPPPAFQASTYTVSLDAMEILDTRSVHTDTDYGGLTILVSGQPASTVATPGKISGHDVNNGYYPIGLSVRMNLQNPTDIVIINYNIINSGHQSQSDIDAALTQVGEALASAGAKAAASAVATGAGALIGATIGTGVVPIIGSALGAIAGWLVGEIGSLVFADCDGPVASQQTAYLANQLWAQTQADPKLSFAVNQPGVDSADGCGSNSRYVTYWSITRQVPLKVLSSGLAEQLLKDGVHLDLPAKPAGS